LFIGCSKRGISVGFPFEEEAGVGFALAIAYKDEINIREKHSRALRRSSFEMKMMNIPCLM